MEDNQSKQRTEEHKELLTPAMIEQFIREGYVVVANVFSPAEVAGMRDNLHRNMTGAGVRHGEMSTEDYKKLPRFGVQTQIFYPSWKMRVQEDPRFFSIMSELWRHTYAAGIEGFESYFSGFNPDTGYFYIDRVNYRLPDIDEHQQGGLFLHTDCDPRAPVDDPSKWRPIQASVALTDSMTPTSGGLYVVPRMHTRMKEYVQHPRNGFIKCRGFTRLDRCKDLVDRQEPVFATAGSIILWDNRLPHSTASQHLGPDTREVLFMTYLPNVPRNREYARAQLENYSSRKLPPDFSKQNGSASLITMRDADWHHEFSQLGRYLMAIEEWPSDMM